MSNNSDYNDFRNWQNGDENEGNNPNNHPNGFFFMGPMNPHFRELWNKIQNGEDVTNDIRDYLNIDDIMKQHGPPPQPKHNRNSGSRKNSKRPPSKSTTFTKEEYHKLIEIRGYLAITEQFSHVKALDKLLNQIVMVPIDPPTK